MLNNSKEGNKEGFPYLRWVIRFLGTGLALWLVIRTVDGRELLRQLKGISVSGFAVIFIIYLFNQLLSSLRWKVLLGRCDIQEAIRDLYIVVLYGQTINKILPTSIGGDSARIAYLLKRYPDRKSHSISATILDRFLAFFALVILAILTLPFGNAFPAREKWLAGFVMVVFIIFFFLFYRGILDDVFKWVMKISFLPEFMRKYMEKFWSSILLYRSGKRILGTALMISLLKQFLMIFNIYLTFHLVGNPIPLSVLFVILPLINLIVILPISIGGIGLREAALVLFLPAGSDAVLSFTLLRYSFIIVLGVLLWVYSALEPFRGKLPSSGDRQ